MDFYMKILELPQLITQPPGTFRHVGKPLPYEGKRLRDGLIRWNI